MGSFGHGIFAFAMVLIRGLWQRLPRATRAPARAPSRSLDSARAFRWFANELGPSMALRPRFSRFEFSVAYLDWVTLMSWVTSEASPNFKLRQ